MSRFSQRLNVILTYHRVSNVLPHGMYEPAVFVTAGTFEMHLRELGKIFEFVPLADLIKYGERKKGLCAITFDDGWLETYEVAFPILKRYHAPATVFVPAGLIGKESCFWFEDLIALANKAAQGNQRLGFIDHFSRAVPAWKPSMLDSESVCALISHMKSMPAHIPAETISRAYEDLSLEYAAEVNIIGWEHMMEMSRSSISFGPHGFMHFILPTLESRIKRQEIFEPLQMLEDRRISSVPIFSYPNGDWDGESLAMLSEAGYKAAVSTRFGYNDPWTDPFLLKRIGMHDYISSTPSLLWFRMYQAFF